MLAISRYFNPRSPCGERRSVGFPNAALRSISIHALLAESDSSKYGKRSTDANFNPRSPCGERPQFSPSPREGENISIHALLAESDVIRNFPPRAARGFQSTLSLRRATFPIAPFTTVNYFNPRSPCGERPDRTKLHYSNRVISIHALLAESDIDIIPSISANRAISIHALLAESDDRLDAILSSPARFQSTLSLRRATRARRCHADAQRNFNPRSPCGERPAPLTGAVSQATISIHALLAESDFESVYVLFCGSLFQSTLSLRRATWRKIIHMTFIINFNPRSPCGERP